MNPVVIWPAVFCMAVADACAQSAGTVTASSFGFDPEDATGCLQAAIDSNAKTVVVDRQPSDWVVRPIRLRSGQELVFGDGVVVRALPGAFTNRNDCLFLAQDVRDVTMRGEGRAVLRMRKADYDDKNRYVRSEWRHVLSLRHAVNVRAADLSLESSGGDGIYLDKCENVSVVRVVARDNYRQGVSVIGVKGLAIRDSRFCDTSGAAHGPWAGIDFEPNEPGESITGVLIENCEFANNHGGGFHVNLSRFTSDSMPIDITVRNCRISGNKTFGIKMSGSQGTPVRGRMLFDGCEIAGGERHAMLMANQVAGSVDVTFRDCVFNGLHCMEDAAICFSNMRFQTFGSVHFGNSRVLCRTGQEPLRYVALPENGMSDVSGTLQVERNGIVETLALADFAARHPPDSALKSFYPRHDDFSSWLPVNPDARRKTSDGFMWFRGSMSFVQHIPHAGEYPISIRLQAIGRGSLQSLVEVYGPDGVRIDRFRARGESTAYSLKAAGAGVYMFRLNSFGHAITVDSPWPGQGILADVPVPIIGGRKNAAPYRFSFVVPAGTKKVMAQIMPGGPAEAAQAQLEGPGGEKILGELKGSGYLICAVRADPSAREIWTLALPTVREDCSFSIAAPCMPVVSSEPDLVLTK